MSATAPPTRSTSRPPTESSPQRKAFRPIAPTVCPQRQDHPVTSTSALTNASNGQFPSVQRVRLYRVPWTKQLTPIGARSSSKSAGGPRTASISPRLSAPAPKRHKRIVDSMSDYETRYRATSYTWYRRSDQLNKGNCCETLQITPAWLRSTSIWLRARDHTIAAFRALETIVEEDRNAAPPPRADAMSITELSAALGVRSSALRFWEEQGLVTPERKSPLGARGRYVVAVHRR